jgi:hypothetical protein
MERNSRMIDAIPRWYDGITFRSSLEADWAATLDSLGIAWEYEPTTVTLPSGATYVPDFHLPEIGTWIEVKGRDIPRTEKAREYAGTLVCRCDIGCGCEWPGGEIVLLGWASIRSGDRPMRFGAMHWDDALGHNALLAQCEACSTYSWCRIRHSITCRKCGARHQGHLHNSGEIEFRRASRAGDFALTEQEISAIRGPFRRTGGHG